MKSMVSRTAFLIAHATTSSGFRRNESNAEPQTDQQRPLADGCGMGAKNIGGGRSQKACWIYSSFGERKAVGGQVGQDRQSCDDAGREGQTKRTGVRSSFEHIEKHKMRSRRDGNG